MLNNIIIIFKWPCGWLTAVYFCCSYEPPGGSVDASNVDLCVLRLSRNLSLFTMNDTWLIYLKRANIWPVREPYLGYYTEHMLTDLSVWSLALLSVSLSIVSAAELTLSAEVHPNKRAQSNAALTAFGGRRGMCVNIKNLSDFTMLGRPTNVMGTHTESTNKRLTLPPKLTSVPPCFSQLEVGVRRLQLA